MGKWTALAKSPLNATGARWIAKGPFSTPRPNGKRGGKLPGLAKRGVVRRAAKAERDFRIIEGHRAGFSTRKLARLFKLTQQGICKVLQRDLSGVTTELHR